MGIDPFRIIIANSSLPFDIHWKITTFFGNKEANKAWKVLDEVLSGGKIYSTWQGYLLQVQLMELVNWLLWYASSR